MLPHERSLLLLYAITHRYVHEYGSTGKEDLLHRLLARRHAELRSDATEHASSSLSKIRTQIHFTTTCTLDLKEILLLL